MMSTGRLREQVCSQLHRITPNYPQLHRITQNYTSKVTRITLSFAIGDAGICVRFVKSHLRMHSACGTGGNMEYNHYYKSYKVHIRESSASSWT